jgi:hypothetical protein
MEPGHARHEVAVLLLLLLEVLLLKPSIACGCIGWVAEAACVAGSSTASSQAMVQAHQAIYATGVLLSTIAQLGIRCRRHVHLLILVVVVLMVVACHGTTSLLSIGVALVIVDIGTIAVLVLGIGRGCFSVLFEDAELAHLVPEEAEVVVVLIIKLVVVFVVIIVHVIVLRAQIRELVLVVLALEGLEALYEAPNSTMLAALVLLAAVLVVAILAWVGSLLLMLLLLVLLLLVVVALVALVVAAALLM